MTVPQRNKHIYNMTQIFHSKEFNQKKLTISGNMNQLNCKMVQMLWKKQHGGFSKT